MATILKAWDFDATGAARCGIGFDVGGGRARPPPRACPPLRNRGSDPPIVFCHGVGVNLLPYAGLLGPLFSRADEVHFINELLRLSRSISQLI